MKEISIILAPAWSYYKIKFLSMFEEFIPKFKKMKKETILRAAEEIEATLKVPIPNFRQIHDLYIDTYRDVWICLL